MTHTPRKEVVFSSKQKKNKPIQFSFEESPELTDKIHLQTKHVSFSMKSIYPHLTSINEVTLHNYEESNKNMNSIVKQKIETLKRIKKSVDLNEENISTLSMNIQQIDDKNALNANYLNLRQLYINCCQEYEQYKTNNPDIHKLRIRQSFPTDPSNTRLSYDHNVTQRRSLSVQTTDTEDSLLNCTNNDYNRQSFTNEDSILMMEQTMSNKRRSSTSNQEFYRQQDSTSLDTQMFHNSRIHECIDLNKENQNSAFQPFIYPCKSQSLNTLYQSKSCVTDKENSQNTILNREYITTLQEPITNSQDYVFSQCLYPSHDTTENHDESFLPTSTQPLSQPSFISSYQTSSNNMIPSTITQGIHTDSSVSRSSTLPYPGIGIPSNEYSQTLTPSLSYSTYPNDSTDLSTSRTSTLIYPSVSNISHDAEMSTFSSMQTQDIDAMNGDVTFISHKNNQDSQNSMTGSSSSAINSSSTSTSAYSSNNSHSKGIQAWSSSGSFSGVDPCVSTSTMSTSCNTSLYSSFPMRSNTLSNHFVSEPRQFTGTENTIKSITNMNTKESNMNLLSKPTDLVQTAAYAHTPTIVPVTPTRRSRAVPMTPASFFSPTKSRSFSACGQHVPTKQNSFVSSTGFSSQSSYPFSQNSTNISSQSFPYSTLDTVSQETQRFINASASQSYPETEENEFNIYQSNLFYQDTITQYEKHILCQGYGLDNDLKDIIYTDTSVTFYGNRLYISSLSYVLLSKVLGVGGYSIVFQGTYYRSNEEPQIVALKMNKSNASSSLSSYEHIKMERNRLKTLNNPFVIHYICDIPDYSNHITGYVMEFVEGMSLTSYIQKKSYGRVLPGLIESEILPILYQLIQALCYLESTNHVHLDIKPDNILISSTQCIKLIDFGTLSRFNINPNDLSSYVDNPYNDGFTLRYAAKEVLNQSPTCRSDVFSVGATLYHMITGKPPRDYVESASYNMYNLVLTETNDILLPENYIKQFSDEFLHLYNQCLQPNSDDRPHASDLIHSPLFASLNKSQFYT